jgi:hypothetical protein
MIMDLLDASPDTKIFDEDDGRAFAKFELKDEATVVLSRTSGLPLRLEHRREVALGTASSSNPALRRT